MDLLRRRREFVPPRESPGFGCPNCARVVPFNAKRCKCCGQSVVYAGLKPGAAGAMDTGAARGNLPGTLCAAIHGSSGCSRPTGRAGATAQPLGDDVPNAQLTPCETFSATELCAHLSSLRCEPLHRALRQLVQRLMLHSMNQGWFNEPVDAERLQLPDYGEIIARPMDLGTIKSKLSAFEYPDVVAFAADVRLVFENATTYNPPRNAVHTAAVEMVADFDAELARTVERMGRATVRTEEHECGLCQGKRCVLCNEKCLSFETPSLICSGPCAQKVRRDQTYHVTRDGSRLWCHKCYLGLKSVIPPPPECDEPAAAGLWYKRDLIKRKFDEDVAEPWVQCDACARWTHQTCALFNAKAEADATGRDNNGGVPRFVCPLCELQGTHVEGASTGKQSASSSSSSSSPAASVGEVSGSAMDEDCELDRDVSASGVVSTDDGSRLCLEAPTAAKKSLKKVPVVARTINIPVVDAHDDDDDEEVDRVGGSSSPGNNNNKKPMLCSIRVAISEMWNKAKGGGATPPPLSGDDGNHAPDGAASSSSSVVSSSASSSSATASAPEEAGNNELRLVNVVSTVAGEGEDHHHLAAGAPPAAAPKTAAVSKAHLAEERGRRPPPTTGSTSGPLPLKIQSFSSTRLVLAVDEDAALEEQRSSSTAAAAADTTFGAASAAAASGRQVVVRKRRASSIKGPSYELELLGESASYAEGESKKTWHTVAALERIDPESAEPAFDFDKAHRAAKRVKLAKNAAAPGDDDASSSSSDAKKKTTRTRTSSSSSSSSLKAASLKREDDHAPAVDVKDEDASDGGALPARESMTGDSSSSSSSSGSSSGSARRRRPRRHRTPPKDPRGWWRASDLPETHMTRHLERAVRCRMRELGGSAAELAHTAVVRVVSTVPQSLRVPSVLRRTFANPDGSVLAETLPFESRAVVLFQRMDGVDLSVFSMYVHEFRDDRGRAGPSARRVYIAYLDSVEYFRPRTARTAVYHELLVAYLEWSRRRGFEAAHIWACPPQRGNNFIFWCHPPHQRTPSRDRLAAWYKAMIARAVEVRAVTRVATLYDEHYAHLDTLRRHRAAPGTMSSLAPASTASSSSSGGKSASQSHKRVVVDARLLPEQTPVCPPLFDGDYWPDEACRLHALIERRKGLFGSALTSGSYNGALRSSHETLSVEAQFDALLKTVLQQPSAYPFMRPVDPIALGVPDYHKVITQPMDLGTVEQNLARHAYSTPQPLIDDVRLVFRNAQLFNPPAHPVHEAASHLSLLFEKKLQSLLARLKLKLGVTDAAAVRDFKFNTTEDGGDDPAAATTTTTTDGPPATTTNGGGGETPAGFQQGDQHQRTRLATADGPPVAADSSLSAAAASSSLELDAPPPSSSEGGDDAATPCGGGNNDDDEVMVDERADEEEDKSSDDDDDDDEDDSEDEAEDDEGEKEEIVAKRRLGAPAPSIEHKAQHPKKRERKKRRKEEVEEEIITLPRQTPRESAMEAAKRCGGELSASNMPMCSRLPAELAASVHKMKDALFVLYLQDDQRRAPKKPDKIHHHPGALATMLKRSSNLFGAHAPKAAAKESAVAASPPTTPASALAAAPPDPAPPQSMVINAAAPPDPAPVGEGGGGGGDDESDGDTKAPPQAPAVDGETAKAPPRKIVDPDEGVFISCPLLDSRHTFLEMCQFWHYQFDTLRRAKHSSIMLLYHMHNPTVNSLRILCSHCSREIRRVRWHCSTCIDYDVCRDCERQGRDNVHPHVLTPYRISFRGRRQQQLQVSF